MTKRKCCRIGSIGRLRQGPKLQLTLHHLLHLQFVCRTRTRDCTLHLAWCVLHYVDTATRSHSEHQSTGLTDAHCRSNIVLEEDLLDSNCLRRYFVHQNFEVGLQRGQSNRQIVRHSGGHYTHLEKFGHTRLANFNCRITASSEAWIDSQNDEPRLALGIRLWGEHMFILVAWLWRFRLSSPTPRRQLARKLA